MLTKRKVLSLALTLTKAGDSELIGGDDLFADEALTEADKARVRDVVEIVHEVCSDYSYLLSAAFTKQALSKSEAFMSMKAKTETFPSRRQERLEDVFAAIRNSLDDPQRLFELVREDQHASVNRLLTSLQAVALPLE